MNRDELKKIISEEIGDLDTSSTIFDKIDEIIDENFKTNSPFHRPGQTEDSSGVDKPSADTVDAMKNYLLDKDKIDEALGEEANEYRTNAKKSNIIKKVKQMLGYLIDQDKEFATDLLTIFDIYSKIANRDWEDFKDTDTQKETMNRMNEVYKKYREKEKLNNDKEKPNTNFVPPMPPPVRNVKP